VKSKTKPKQDSYVVLQRWMRTELGLEGNELTVYAIIYGFSQDGESVYKGGYGYLADWIGLSENGARNIVKKLVARGLLKELKIMVGGILVNQYVAVRNPVPETVPEDGADPYKNCTPTKNVPLQKVYPNPYKKCIQTPTKSVDRKYIGKPIGKPIYPREERGTDVMDGLDTAREDVLERFREQLELDTLERRYEPEKLEELLDNIVDMYCCPSMIQTIGQYPQTTQSIRKRLDKLTSQHIEYVLDALLNSTKSVHNIQGYIRAVLLNAPTTMEHYYQAKVNSITAKSRGECGK
jgi:DNA-binding Lrp family transcriptional regulator